MRIALLSDIHDHLPALAAALDYLTGTDCLLCCGDFCSPFVVKMLGDRYAGPVHAVFGNNDADTYRMMALAQGYGGRVQLHGEWAELELDGKKVALNHFPEIARPLAESGRYDLVGFGHNHQQELSYHGKVSLLNPGTLMGYRFEAGAPVRIPAGFAIYDSHAHHARLFTMRRQGEGWQIEEAREE